MFLFILFLDMRRDQPDLNDVQFEYTIETTNAEEHKENGAVTEAAGSCLGDYKVICDLSLVAKALDACEFCYLPLRLSQCHSMQCIGLGCQLHIKCDNTNCRRVNVINVSNTHKYKEKGQARWNTNTKAAAGKKLYQL